MGAEWGDTGSGPGWDADPKNAFKPTVPVPEGNEWPVLKSAQDVEAEKDSE